MAKSHPPPDAGPPSSLPTWLSYKRVLFGRICVNSVTAFVSFFIFVPIIMTKKDSVGQCILYADDYGFGEISVCNYCIAIAVLLLIKCVVMIVIGALQLTKFSSKISFIHNLIVKGVILVVDLTLLLLLLVAACMISVGFSRLCGIFQDSSECDSKYGVGIYQDWKVNDTFYGQLSVAQGAVWFTFCLWLLIVIIEMLLFWKEGSLDETTVKAKGLFGKSSSQV